MTNGMLGAAKLRITCPGHPGRSFVHAARLVAMVPDAGFLDAPDEEAAGHTVIHVPWPAEDQLLCGATMRRLPIPATWGPVVVSLLAPRLVSFDREREFGDTQSDGKAMKSLSFDEARDVAAAEAKMAGAAGHDPAVDPVGPATPLLQQLFPDIPVHQAELEDEMVRLVDAVASVDPTLLSRVEVTLERVDSGTQTSQRLRTTIARHVADNLRLFLLVPPGDRCSRCRPFEVDGHGRLPEGHDESVALTPCEEGRVVLHPHEVHPPGKHTPMRLPRFVQLFRANFEATHRDFVRSMVAEKSADECSPHEHEKEKEGGDRVDSKHETLEYVLVHTGDASTPIPMYMAMAAAGELSIVDSPEGATQYMYRAWHGSPTRAIEAERKRLRKLDARGGDVSDAARETFDHFTVRFPTDTSERTEPDVLSHGVSRRCLGPSVPTRWSTLNKLVRYIVAPLLLFYDPDATPCRCEVAAVGHAATLLCHIVLELMGRSWGVLPGSGAVPTAEEAVSIDFITATPEDEAITHPAESNAVRVHGGLFEKLISALDDVADHRIFFFEEDVFLCDMTLRLMRPIVPVTFSFVTEKRRSRRFPSATPKTRSRSSSVNGVRPHTGPAVAEDCQWPPPEAPRLGVLGACVAHREGLFRVWSYFRHTPSSAEIAKALQVALFEIAFGTGDQARISRLAALCYGGRRDGTALSLEEFVRQVEEGKPRGLPLRLPLLNRHALRAESDAQLFNLFVGEGSLFGGDVLNSLEWSVPQLLSSAAHQTPGVVKLWLHLTRKSEQPPRHLREVKHFTSNLRSSDLLAWAERIDTRPTFPPARMDVSERPAAYRLYNDFAMDRPVTFGPDPDNVFGPRSIETTRFLHRLAPLATGKVGAFMYMYTDEGIRITLLKSADSTALKRYMVAFHTKKLTSEHQQFDMAAAFLFALRGDPNAAAHLGAAPDIQRTNNSEIQLLRDLLLTPATATAIPPDFDSVAVSHPDAWLTAELPIYHLMSEGYLNLAATAFTTRASGYRRKIGDGGINIALLDAIRCDLASAYCTLVDLGESVAAIAVTDARRPALVALASAYVHAMEIDSLPDSRAKSHLFETLHAVEKVVSIDVARALERMYSPFVDPLPDAAGAVPSTFAGLYAAAVAEVQGLPEYAELLLVLSVVLDDTAPLRIRLRSVNEDLWMALPCAVRSTARGLMQPGDFLVSVDLKPSSMEPALARLLYALCSTVFPASYSTGTQILAASRHKPDRDLVARYPPDPDAPLPHALRELSVDGLKSKGNHAFAQGKTALAITCYHSALTKLADSGLDNAVAAVLCSNLSLAYLTIRDANGAHLMAAAAMELSPKQPKPWLRAVQAALAFPFRHPPSIATAAAGQALLHEDPPIPRDAALEEAAALITTLRHPPLRSTLPMAKRESSLTAGLCEFDRIAAIVAASPDGIDGVIPSRSGDTEAKRRFVALAGPNMGLRDDANRALGAVHNAAAARYGTSDPRVGEWGSFMAGVESDRPRPTKS